MKTVREDKVEKADEKMIMENVDTETRCNRAVKQKETAELEREERKKK